MDYIWHYQSPLGAMTMASDGLALVGLWFDDRFFFADTLAPCHEKNCLPVFGECRRWLDTYFRGKAPGFIPTMNLRTTPFRKGVLDILLSIPYGQTITYGEVAARMARQMQIPRMSAQAVGGALKHNPIALIVPCHRVIGANGSLTGYAGGLDRKRALLELEALQTV